MEYMTAMSGQGAFALGAQLAGLGVLAVGAEGGGLAWMLARTVGCGAALHGADVLFHDGSTPAAGAWLARHYELPAALYFQENGGQAALWLHDGQGQVMERRKLAPAAGWAGPAGTWDRLAGTDTSYAAHQAGGRRLDGATVTVMEGQGQKPLILALERLGCEVLSRPRPGVPLLRCDRSGFHLTVQDGLEELRPAGRDGVSAAVDWCLSRMGRGDAIPAFGEGHGGRQV